MFVFLNFVAYYFGSGPLSLPKERSRRKQCHRIGICLSVLSLE